MPVRNASTSLTTRLTPHYPYNTKIRVHRSASPSKQSVQRLKTKVRELLVPSNNDPWPEVRDDLNRTLRGWSSCFNLGSPVASFRSVDHYVRERVRGFLARRHKVTLPARSWLGLRWVCSRWGPACEGLSEDRHQHTTNALATGADLDIRNELLRVGECSGKDIWMCVGEFGDGVQHQLKLAQFHRRF